MDESTHLNLALCGFATLIQMLDGGTNLKISGLAQLHGLKNKVP
jgi:hypothetical protein